MPDEDQLPPSLTPLARRQALELSPSRFSSDTESLLRALERSLAEAEAARHQAVAPAAEPPARKRQPAPPASWLTRRARALAATLALAGAAVSIVAYTLDTSRPDATIVFAPEMLGIPLLVAAVGILLQAGRIREQLAYGMLLGFGLLTSAGAIGLHLLSERITGGQEDRPVAVFMAGVLVLAAGLVGASRVVRAPGAWSAPFRWGTASLLATAGALVAVTAMFIPFGETSGPDTRVLHLGNAYGLTGVALEPTVAVALTCLAIYALGKGGGVRLLAAGASLALGAQTVLFYSNLLAAVLSDYTGHWNSKQPGPGLLVALAAAALLVAAGLVARRSP